MRRFEIFCIQKRRTLSGVRIIDGANVRLRRGSRCQSVAAQAPIMRDDSIDPVFRGSRAQVRRSFRPCGRPQTGQNKKKTPRGILKGVPRVLLASHKERRLRISCISCISCISRRRRRFLKSAPRALSGNNVKTRMH